MGQSHSDNQITMYKVLAAAALFAVVAADKVPVAYAPAPAYHKPAPYVPEKLPPQPFAYEYGVADDYSKANFKKSETQDANGVVSGSFVIALPDGESRPPPTPLTTPTDSSLMSPMREPQSTHQSPRRDTDMPQLTRPQSPLMLQSSLQLTLQLPKNLKIPKD